MSQLQIRNTLLQAIEDAASVPVAYENDNFKPKGLDAYYQFAFIPVTSESMGKTANDSDDERGFINLNVYVKQNAKDFDNQQLALIDEMKAAIYSGKQFDDVGIMEVEVTGARYDSGWCVRTLTINYTSYIART